MPDYSGAKAAMRDRFATNWNTTPIVFQNKGLPEGWNGAWPPVDGDGLLLPWTYMEVLGVGAPIAGFGTAGNRVWTYEGDILVHVFVPAGDGDDVATQYAVAIGEIFRAAQFYDETPGYYVKTFAPSIDDGDTSDDDGNWFRVTMTVGFTYWHRG